MANSTPVPRDPLFTPLVQALFRDDLPAHAAERTARPSPSPGRRMDWPAPETIPSLTVAERVQVLVGVLAAVSLLVYLLERHLTRAHHSFTAFKER